MCIVSLWISFEQRPPHEDLQTLLIAPILELLTMFELLLLPLLRVKMNIHSVCHHDIFWLERFPTLVTYVRFLSSMFSQMSFEQRWRCEDLQTILIAPILELLTMFEPLLRVKMNIHSMCHHDIFWLKRFPTLVTYVRFLSSVFSQMSFEQRWRREHLQTPFNSPNLWTPHDVPATPPTFTEG